MSDGTSATFDATLGPGRPFTRLEGLMLGAGALRGARIVAEGVPPGLAGAFIAGGLSAFGSTVGAARVLWREPRRGRALYPYALYRCLIAALLVRRSRRPPPRQPSSTK